ncbi:hypothetical protein NG895_19715 [Aeoliella sp. ICT_H6.2]|uniref:PEP-CTERM protein-sorting domain-containing protein n=1 Tax=Aeoliella straminimaris TaxID=2954799 RepID=A0A9X2FCN7_9BACT|nr:hypothetical protein [Aeoliella straminimaris]MCO6046134.1 hypothetical protein [Aeoliella straminimaris]
MNSEFAVTVLPGLGPDAWHYSNSIEQSAAYGINNNGVVVGSTGSNPRLSGEGEAVQWIDGAIEILPRLPNAMPYGVNFAATDVNEIGIIVGFTAFPIPADQYASHAVKWVGGVPTDLGTLPGHESSYAVAVNNSGQVTGTSEFGGFFGTQTAVRWSADGQISPLGLLSTQDPSLVNQGLLQHDRGSPAGINASGRIVGASELFGGDLPRETLPVYWDSNTASPLPLPSGFNFGSAVGINDDGNIVGFIATYDLASFSFSTYRAALWHDAESEPELLALPDGIEYGAAIAVNSLGQIIGAGAADPDDARYGFASNLLLWNADGSFVDLTPFLVAAFPGENRFRLSDINDQGQITGYSLGATGERDGFAFVLTPVPEPAGVVLFICGATGLLALRYRCSDSSRSPQAHRQ